MFETTTCSIIRTPSQSALLPKIQYFAWGFLNVVLMTLETAVRSAWMQRVPAEKANKLFHYHFRLWANAAWGLVICLRQWSQQT